MPANEQTWRNIPLLHRVFAISGIAMLIATIWVFWNDQSKEWRRTQTRVVNIDTTMNQWRQQQYATDTATAAHERRAEEKLRKDAEPIDPEHLAEFGQEVQAFHADMEALGDSTRIRYDAEGLLSQQEAQAELALESETAWKEAEFAEATAEEQKPAYLEQRSAAKKEDNPAVIAAAEEASAAQQAALEARQTAHEKSLESARARQRIVDQLNDAVTYLRNRENVALGERKFKSADWDASKANVDIGVRDNVGPQRMQELEAEVVRIKGELDVLNENYQQKNESRVALQKIVTRITARQAAAAKSYEEALADLEALQEQYEVRSQNYVDFTSSFPWISPGKGLLNLPVLNAFNPPQKIENLWSEGLTQNYNFRPVRRFDRCTTCHQLQGFFTRSANWPLGSAMAMTMLVLTLAVVLVGLRAVNLRRVLS
jgi:hypothetical protein